MVAPFFSMGAIHSLQVRLLARDMGQVFDLGVVARTRLTLRTHRKRVAPYQVRPANPPWRTPRRGRSFLCRDMGPLRRNRYAPSVQDWRYVAVISAGQHRKVSPNEFSHVVVRLRSGADGTLWRRRTLPTEISWPRLAGAAAIRSKPQDWSSLAMRTIRSSMSLAMGGLPQGRVALFYPVKTYT
jgi:hypothetical protein